MNLRKCTTRDGLSDETVRLLEKNGLRMTTQRRKIIEILTSSKCSSPKELWYEAKEYVPDLGIATVYRLINRLEQIGLIKKNRTLGMQVLAPKLGSIKDECGHTILNEGSVMDLENIIKHGLINEGKILKDSDVKLSLVGDTINITVISA